MDKKSLLHRQVNASWVHNGVPSSQTFSPTPKDDGMLSVYNGEKFTAEQAYTHFNGSGLGSAGVLSVSGEECEEIDLPYTEDNVPFDGHTSIDYTQHTSNQQSKKAKILKNRAWARGWQYPSLTGEEAE